VLCPSDNKKHHGVTVEELTCCYTILSNLPKNNKEQMCCYRHPKKKIKFYCEAHSEFLCTTCVLQHTGPGHIVTNFTITRNF
jgi:hypothetical protein